MSLDVKRINKNFGANHVLKDVSFTAKQGAALGLLGRNGSGKTTTIRIIMDIFYPDSGEVTIDGVANNKTTKRIGYLPEERGLYPKIAICDQMSYFARLRGVPANEAKKRSLYLLERLEAGEYFKKKLDTLSKGNQQKIQLAIALINDPDVIILDEPFSGLDPVNANILKSVVSEMVQKGKIVLFSSHQMSSVEEFCDDICIINKGDIVLSGELKKIKKSYPRNRLLINPENENYAGLAGLLKSNSAIASITESIEPVKHGVILSLKDEKTKNQAISAIMALEMDIDSISVIEPTLEEIFIEKAGNSEQDGGEEK